MHLDDIDRMLLNLIQGEFPLHQEPFFELGTKLGIASDQVIRRIEKVKTMGIVRQISPVLNARSLGYRTTLVAMKIKEDRLDRVSQVLSEHPGVSHSYKRDHDFNLWFTLSLPADVDIQGEIKELSTSMAAEAVLDLPAVRIFKIGAYFDVAGDGCSILDTNTANGGTLPKGLDLSPVECAIIRELQQDLPLIPRPFDSMAAHLSIDTAEFLTCCLNLKYRGIMRRYGAAINHHSVGFKANAMTCWRVAPSMVEKSGLAMAVHNEVSHCYERKTSPLWPYNLFAVIHGHTMEACQAVASMISRETGLMDYISLFSIKEFKKVRVRYLV